MPETVTTLYEESKAQQGFYTPRFEVRIEGANLPRNVLRDVTSITYHDNIHEIDGFELTVNNWDADTRSFKYVGSETSAQLEPSHPDSARLRLFEPCVKQVEIRMGYLGQLTLMVKGNFTSLEPKFTSSAAPTLNVRGLNVLHKLRTKQFTHIWMGLPDMRDSAIVQNLGTLRDPRGGPRFPLPIRISREALATEQPNEYVAEQNQYDIDFLLERARRLGYVVYIIPDQSGRTEGTLYFGPRDTNDSNSPQPLRNVTFQLHWGRSLVEFKPTMTTATQVKSVTVYGWNRRTRRPIEARVTLDDARIRCNRDLHRLLQQCDPREEVVVTEPVSTPAEAKSRALAILNDRQHEFVKCDATTVGLPDLRAGMKVDILNVGARFSGRYFITQTTHTINDSGYLTQFKAQRDDPGRVR
jgi:phage protein D